MRLIFQNLERLGDPLLKSCLIDPIRDEIARNPDRYMSLLSIEVKDVRPKKQRSFISIMISRGKGAAFESNYEQPASMANTIATPIGFTERIEVKQNLSCVGVAN